MASAWKAGLSLVFSKWRYSGLFAFLSLILAAAYAALTNILLLFPLSISPFTRLPETALILMAALLAALGFTIAAYQLFELKKVAKASIGGEIIGTGAIGTLVGTFATSCAICQPVWLAWLGLGSASVFLVNYSIYILLASLAVLLYSVHTGLKSIAECCRPRRKK